MRLFIVGDTPLVNRVGIAFEDWFPDGVVKQHGMDENLLEEMLRFRPTVVLENLVEGDVDWNGDDGKYLFPANATEPGTVALFARGLGADLYHVSDSYVFPGRAPAASIDTPYPSNLYGYSRLLGERTVSSLHPNVAIIRHGWLYGHDIPSSPVMIAQEALDGARQSVHVYEDLWGSPTYVGDAAAMLAFRIMQAHTSSNPFKGVFHLAPTVSTDWCSFLSEDYPVSSSKFRNKISRVWHRDASLVPSDGWTIAANGLDRFREDYKNKAWDWTASLLVNDNGYT